MDTNKESVSAEKFLALLAEARTLSSSVVWDRGLGHASLVDIALINHTPELKLIGPVYAVRTDGNILAILQALDNANPHDILVIEDTVGEDALLGDIVMLAAKQKGIAGIACNGKVRDIADANRLELPVWARGVSPRATTIGEKASALGKAQLGACLLLTGDWLFGDRDGLVHVPGDQARLVIKAAAIKDKKERLYKQRMHDGENLITMMNVRAHLSAGEPIKVEF
jgi:4-hydroxy-4-methyl-2-oxoglutarate aldolase